MNGPRRIDSLDLDELERLAHQLIDDGAASRQLEIALEQLVADRTNGEPLDEPAADLRAALSKCLAGELSVANDDPPSTV